VLGNQFKVNNFATDAGTAYRNTKRIVRINDWALFSQWILETGNTHCLEKRPAKLAVLEIVDGDGDEAGELPPGLEYFEEEEFLVRKPSKSK